MTKLPGHTKQQLLKLLQYIRHDYRLTFWLYLNRCRQLAAFLRRHFDLIRRTSFILTAVALGVLIRFFGGTNFTQDGLSNYLVAAGAMTGTTIAIVFTISIFLLQNTSDMYSSQYLEAYIHDWKEKFVYFTAILITLGLLGGGLFVGGLSTIPVYVTSFLVPSSLVLIATVFALIDWQYKLVRHKITPSTTIAFLEKEGIRFLSRLQYDAGKMAGIMQAKDGSISNDLALATAYNHFLQPFISNLDRQLENLVEISSKLADRQEVATTKRGLTAVYHILEMFLDARKTSSLIVPSDVAFLAVESDSQRFLTSNCERLNKIGDRFIKEGKDELAVHIIGVYRLLAVKAKDITFIGQRNDNPVLDLFTAYLNFLIEHAQRAQNIEVVYQGSRVLGDIAAIAAEKGLESTLVGLQEKLSTIAAFGLTQKQLVIVDKCTMTFLCIVDALFGSTRITRQHHVASAFKNLAAIVNHHATRQALGLLPHDFSTSLSLTKPYDELYALLRGIMTRYSELTDEDLKTRYRHDLVELFHQLNVSLRELSEELKSCDTILTDTIGRLLFNINSLIIELMADAEFADERYELRRGLSWNIHLPAWFAHHAATFDGGSMPFRTLIESAAKTGILAAERLGDQELVNDCIDALGSLTMHCLEKTTNTYGFDEPRVLEKACYLGIIGLKRGWREVVTNIGLKIYEYEPKYNAKYFSKLRLSDQLQRELWRWRDDFERDGWSALANIRDDAETMMYGPIEQIDIDRFVFEVWGVWLEHTKFETEVKLKLARARLLRELERVMERRRHE